MKHGTSNRRVPVAVLTVSDTRSLEDDRSGAVILEGLAASGHHLIERVLVRDERSEITQAIEKWIETGTIHAIIVSGGTGPSPRDQTPDAIRPLFTSRMQGFGELFRMLSYETIGAAAMLSRADAGWIDTPSARIPVFILPGSPNAVQLAMEKLILPQLGHLYEVCSLEAKS